MFSLVPRYLDYGIAARCTSCAVELVILVGDTTLEEFRALVQQHRHLHRLPQQRAAQ